MKKQFIGFHGDRGWFKIDHLPKGAKLVKKTKEHVDAWGETTGHKHLLKSEKEFEVYEYNQKIHGETIKRWVYLLTAPAEVSHEEHLTHDIQPGIYFMDQENEESPQDGMIRKVVD